jgi:hypothetical protein
VKPGSIRVFDGLRVATEHINHLQDALQSSIDDLREAVGLGRVLHGFDVLPEGDAAIVVGPGLAFDRNRHRLVVDEPQRLDVQFPLGRDVLYVCARYEQVEDGEVEGRSTLVWDSAALVLADALPAPEDDIFPLAKLVRAEGAGGFRVVGLEPEPAEDAAKREAPAEAPAPAPEAAAGVRVRQGVLDIAQPGVAEPGPLAAMAAALRARASGEAEGDGDVRVVVAGAEVALDFPLVSLSCATIVSASLQAPEGAGAHCQLTARGEATAVGGRLEQFGLTTVHAPRAPEGDPAAGWSAAELTEGGVALLPLDLIAVEGDPAAREAVAHLQLAVEAALAAPSGFGVACALVWKGDAGEERIQALEGGQLTLSWGVRIGWKATGA